MISVDPREGSKQYAALLEARGLPVELVRLPYADVSFTGHGPSGLVEVGVEIKTAGDFQNSFADKRWQGQLGGMQKMYDHVCLIVVQQSAFRTPNFLTRQMLTLHYKAGVLSYTAMDESDAGNWIDDLYRWWQKPWEKHQSLTGIQLPKATGSGFTLVPEKHSLTRMWAASLPGIGWELSGRIEKEFDSPAHLVIAPREKWMSVAGIGAKKAQEIVDTINRMKK